MCWGWGLAAAAWADIAINFRVMNIIVIHDLDLLAILIGALLKPLTWEEFKIMITRALLAASAI